MASTFDLAVLAEDVYSQQDNALANRYGWERLDAMCWAQGFAAGLYRRKSEIVVAYRGTDDLADVAADALMVPIVRDGAAGRTLDALLKQYGIVASRASLTLIKKGLAGLLESRKAQSAISKYANRVPTQQTAQALQYFDDTPFNPQFVTGHSLGGALAKVVSDRRFVRAVAFNSPFLGDMQGTTPQCSLLMLNVNAIGDPLSLATRVVGNVSHGATLEVPIPPMSRKPPQPRTASRDHDQLCSAVRAIPTAYVGCHVAGEVSYRTEQAALELEYLRALWDFLAQAALYHHSMTNLRQAISSIAKCTAPIGDTF